LSSQFVSGFFEGGLSEARADGPCSRLKPDFTEASALTTVPPRRINEIVHGKRSISPDTALRLSRAFGTSDRFWMNLQTWTSSSSEFDKIRPLVA
jgi:addiction module HigA family antidote